MSSSLPLIAAVALLLNDQAVEALALGVLAAALYGIGRDTRGQQRFPQD